MYTLSLTYISSITTLLLPGQQQIQKPSAASKRSPEEVESESTNNRKKPRKSNKSEQNEYMDAANFNDTMFEEPKNESENNHNSFTLASFGQTMLSSQENESSRDSGDVDEPKSKPDEKTTPIISRTPAQAVPCARWGQTMTMIDHKRFIVYGGQTIEKDTAKPLSDLFVYDLLDGKWTRPINCDGVARTWHTANFLPDRKLLICFGGEVLNETTGKLVTTDQVMALDTEIMLWYPPSVTGQIPSGRSGHASCVLPDTNELVVFGGVKNGKWLNSVSMLNTNRWVWSTVKAVGDAPPPRSYHRYVLICFASLHYIIICTSEQNIIIPTTQCNSDWIQGGNFWREQFFEVF